MNSKNSLRPERSEASMYRLLCVCSLLLCLLPVFSQGAAVGVSRVVEENSREDETLAHAMLQNKEDFDAQNKGMTTSSDEIIPEESMPKAEGITDLNDVQIDDMIPKYDENTPKRRTKRVAENFDAPIDDTVTQIDENEASKLKGNETEKLFDTHEGMTPSIAENILEDSKAKTKSGKFLGTQTEDPVAGDDNISEELRKPGERSVVLTENETTPIDEDIPQEQKLDRRAPWRRGGKQQNPSPSNGRSAKAAPPNKKSAPPSPRTPTNYLQAKRNMNAPQAPLTVTAPVAASPQKVSMLSNQRTFQRSTRTWSGGRG